jgi:hypothetical protein
VRAHATRSARQQSTAPAGFTRTPARIETGAAAQIVLIFSDSLAQPTG